MKRLGMALLLGIAVMLGGCFGTIETGDVGVRTTFGTVDQTVVPSGIYTAFFSSVTEFSAKENAVEMENLTPKAKDNLTLKDLDVTVYYKAEAGKIAQLHTKYAQMSAKAKGANSYVPSYSLILNISRNIVYEEVSKIDSLVIHTQRDQLAAAVRTKLQEELDKNDPKTFTVTRVIVRSVVTDPAIETAIRNQVNSQKDLETKDRLIEIAQKDAKIEVARAEGISKANGIINNSLTREYLQHEYNLAMMECAKRAGCTMIVGNQSGTLLNISGK